jgi:hypothetical protein
MKVIKKEYREAEYTISLSQSELNTIALLLGKSTDAMVKDCATIHRLDYFCIGNRLTELYSSFSNQMK